MATGRNALGRMRRRPPVDHEWDRLAEAARPRDRGWSSRGARRLGRSRCMATGPRRERPSRRAASLSVSRSSDANGKGHDAWTRQRRDAAAAIALKVLRRIGRDDLEIDRRNRGAIRLLRVPRPGWTPPRAGVTPVRRLDGLCAPASRSGAAQRIWSSPDHVVASLVVSWRARDKERAAAGDEVRRARRRCAPPRSPVCRRALTTAARATSGPGIAAR